MRLALIVAALALVALPSASHAVPACETSWKDPVNGNWTDASKWTAGVPDFDDDACVIVGGASYTVTVDATTNVHTLQVGATTGTDTQTIAVVAPAATTIGFDVSDNDEDAVVNARGVISLGGPGTAVLNADNNAHPFVNHGTIRTEAGGGREIRAAVENATDGEMVFAGGVCICIGRPFVNRGSLTVPAGQTFFAGATTSIEQAGGSWTNSGATKVQQGRLVHSGGNASGNPIELCASELDPSGSGSATYLVRRDTSTGCVNTAPKLIGNVGAGITVRLRNEGESTVDVGLPPAGLTINGTLTMEGGTSGPGDNRVLLAATVETVTVASTGTFEVSGLGQRILQGDLVNNGTVTLHRGVSTNKGFTQSGTGTLHSVIGGSDPATNLGELAAKNDAVVGGKLKTTTTITPSGTYDVVRSVDGARTGTFATTEFVGPTYDVSYEPKSVRLTPNSGGGPPADPPPTPPAPPPDATTHDLRGEWVLETTTAGGAKYTMREKYGAMDKSSGRYSGTGAGGPYSWNTDGTAAGDRVHFVTGPYNELLGYSATFDGTIGADGTITGTWVDTNGQSGTFTQTRVGGGPPPAASDYLGNWTLDALDPSGTYRYSRSTISLTKEDPAQTFTGGGSNPVHLFDAKVAVSGAEVAMTLDNFSGLGVYASRYTGRRQSADLISGTWSDGSTSGMWTMTRSSKAASKRPPGEPTLPASTRTSGGTSFVQVTPPVSCNLSASAGQAFTRAAVSSSASKKSKPKRLAGVRVPKFGPVFAVAGEQVRIPVRPAPLVRKRTRKSAARLGAAATQRASVNVNVSCDPARGPTNSDPPPNAPFELIDNTVSVPITVTTQTQAEPRRPRAGRWVGTPGPGQVGGLLFTVSSTGEISGPGTSEPLIARALQVCGTPAGPLPNGVAKVTLNGKLTPKPTTTYPRTATYVKNQISANGGIRGFVNLAVSFTGDDAGTAMLSGAQPVAPLALGCSIPAQYYTLRYLGNRTAPNFTGGDGTPYITGEDPAALQPGPKEKTAMTLVCIRGPQPTSDSVCRATIVDVGEGLRSPPEGAVRWSRERGSFPDGDSCTLTPRANSNSESSCTVLYRPDAAGTPAGTRIPVAAAYAGSAVHAPSKAEAAGEDLLQVVCIGLWTPDCEGKVPKPNEVQTCVAAWQRCEGFGNSNTKPGTFDMSGLPTTPPRITAQVGCGEQKPGRRRLQAAQSQTETCIINTGVELDDDDVKGSEERLKLLNALRDLRAQVDFRRSMVRNGMLLHLQKNLATVQGTDPESVETRAIVNGINAALGRAVDYVYDLFAQPGAFQRERNGREFFGWPRETIQGPQYCIKAFPSDDPNYMTCIEFVGLINKTIREDAEAILRVQERLGLQRKLDDSKTRKSSVEARLRSADAPLRSAGVPLDTFPAKRTPRRTPFELAAGNAEVGVGETGNLRLDFPSGSRQVLSSLRRRGRRSVRAVIRVQTSRNGVVTTSRQRVVIKLPKK